MRGTRYLPALLAAGLVACQPPAETPEQTAQRMEQESAAARQAIEAQTAKFNAGFTSGDAAAIGSLYAEDARALPPNAPMAVGRAQIQEMWAGVFAMGEVTGAAKTESVIANGPIAIERGSYTMTITPAGMPGMADTGKYLVAWKQVWRRRRRLPRAADAQGDLGLERHGGHRGVDARTTRSARARLGGRRCVRRLRDRVDVLPPARARRGVTVTRTPLADVGPSGQRWGTVASLSGAPRLRSHHSRTGAAAETHRAAGAGLP